MRAQFDKRVIVLRGAEQRERAIALLQRVPLDPERPLRVVVDDPLPSKSRDQEEKYHAMIGDIARQYKHCGKQWSADDMKRLLLDQFRRDTQKDSDIAHLWHSMGVVEMAPALDGSGVVVLGVQSRKFPLRLAIIFIEWLYAFGAELNIVWTEPKGKS
jgi:hypothetical protein